MTVAAGAFDWRAALDDSMRAWRTVAAQPLREGGGFAFARGNRFEQLKVVADGMKAAINARVEEDGIMPVYFRIPISGPDDRDPMLTAEVVPGPRPGFDPAECIADVQRLLDDLTDRHQMEALNARTTGLKLMGTLQILFTKDREEAKENEMPPFVEIVFGGFDPAHPDMKADIATSRADQEGEATKYAKLVATLKPDEVGAAFRDWQILKESPANGQAPSTSAPDHGIPHTTRTGPELPETP